MNHRVGVSGYAPTVRVTGTHGPRANNDYLRGPTANPMLKRLVTLYQRAF